LREYKFSALTSFDVNCFIVSCLRIYDIAWHRTCLLFWHQSERPKEKSQPTLAINMKNKSLIGSLALLTFVVFSGPAKALILPPGGSGPPDDLTGDLAGATELAFHVAEPFVTNTGLTSGTVTTSVFSDPLNTFGAGDLTFVYQVHNSAASMDSIGRVTAINFTGFMTDVGFTLAGGAIPGGHYVDGSKTPVLVDRSIFGDTVGFNFAALDFSPGTTSLTLIIETNATQFAPGVFNIIDGGVASVDAFEPTVPDGGTTVALLGIALAGLEGVRRMFRARKA
jgi:hypothetical protein